MISFLYEEKIYFNSIKSKWRNRNHRNQCRK